MSRKSDTQQCLEESFYRVLYSSKISKSRSSDDIEKDIQSILSYSKSSNVKYDITGVLVTNKKMYAQIIEGPAIMVKDLIGHISCDNRHQDVRIINSYKSDKRIFEDWSMAFVRTNRDLQAEAFMFPSGNEQSNIMAVSAFCTSIRAHVLKSENF